MPRGDLDAHMLEVVQGCALDAQVTGRLAVPGLESRLVVEEFSGEGVRSTKLLDASLVDDLPSPTAGTGTEVHNVVGDGDEVAVVLDHQDGVALVPELPKQPAQAMDVARVQSDGRLVEDVHHPGQIATEVPDHLDALRLSTRESRRLAVQAQIPKADVHQIPKPLDRPGHHRCCNRTLDPAHHFDELAYLHRGEVGDVVAVDLATTDRLVQSRPVTGRATCDRHETPQGFAASLRRGARILVYVEAVEQVHDALEVVAHHGAGR